MKLPNCTDAIVQEIKLTDHLLDKENSKGKSFFFNRIGFDKLNSLMLSEALKKLACSGEIIETELAKFGMKYRVVGYLANPLERDVKVLSIWILDTGSSVLRLLTAYPH